MISSVPIAVTSRSFSRHSVLREELQARYSNIRFNDGGVALSGQDLIEFCRGRRKLITALEVIDESFLAALPELEVIGKYGVGTDMLDKQAMIRHGVELGWTGGVNKRSVSELAMCFMISMLRLVPAANRDVCDGIWKVRKGQYLSSRTVGIIGCGHIGKDLARLLRGFGCEVLAYDILTFPEFYSESGVEAVGLEELLQRSDIVTLHLPKNETTNNIMSAERLSLMKPDAMLINTARGGLVDEAALKVMLTTQRLAAAAFDVLAVEPPRDLELVRLPNFLCTPHIGGSTEEAITAMGRAAIRGLDKHALPSDDYPPGG
jgi:phosphoglycerate dehydrogenase-like enzyme